MIFKPDFKHKDGSCIIKHKEMLKMNREAPFTYVCFSNEKTEGIDCIPYVLKKDVYPKNAVVKYVDVDFGCDKMLEVFRENG